ncbi:ASCH domain-containing protein [Candidatus Poriferisodalis sp.]|uniref:ASCH domain-containing protein n=1 Tax=Candidatus Poriferisodalis sp. TaxID=3101277 RepID=UPI003C6FAD64
MTELLLDPARALVLSLKPRFAQAILAGTKTVEVRRVMPRITISTLALLYASGSARALVGTCVVRSVARYSTDELWHLHGVDTALSKTEFDAYLEGRDCGVALLLECPEPLPPRYPCTRFGRLTTFARPRASPMCATPSASVCWQRRDRRGARLASASESRLRG